MSQYHDHIKDTCKHFTGILHNETCKAGVSYQSVRENCSTGLKLPCFRNSQLAGSTVCPSCAFRTPKEVAIEYKKASDMAAYTMAAEAIVRDHIKATGRTRGKVKCPKCGEKLRYSQATSNGHIIIKCNCGILSME